MDGNSAPGSRRSAASSSREKRVGRPFIDFAAGAEIVRAVLRHPSPKRLGVLATYVGMYSTGRGLSLACQAMDELVDRGWREQAVKEPVFIFANPRSGTTLLHRLMSFDEEHFVGPLLYETVFPSSALIRGIRALSSLDESIPGKPLHRAVDALNAALVGDTWDGIHKLGLDQPEEDEPSFVYNMHTPTAMLMVPHVEEIVSRFWFDELPRDLRERCMDAYEGVLKRVIHAHGGNKRFLNKNVFFAPRVRSVAERFPDARFIYLVRHPYDAMPSFLNMFTSAWRFHSPELASDPVLLRRLAQVGFDYYRVSMRLMDDLPKERFRVVRYDDLIADPKRTIQDVYDWLDLPITEAFEAELDFALDAQRSYESQHDYSLEAFGLSRAEVYRELREVFDRFGFKRDVAHATSARV